MSLLLTTASVKLGIDMSKPPEICSLISSCIGATPTILRMFLFLILSHKIGLRYLDCIVMMFCSLLQSKLRERAAQGQGTSENVIVDDDVFHQVMGRDRHGRVRTFGLGPAPSHLGGPKPSHSEALKMVSEANTEVREMKERMVTMEQTCAQMAAQMATMMSMMSAMQKKSPNRHPPSVS